MLLTLIANFNKESQENQRKNYKWQQRTHRGSRKYNWGTNKAEQDINRQELNSN